MARKKQRPASKPVAGAKSEYVEIGKARFQEIIEMAKSGDQRQRSYAAAYLDLVCKLFQAPAFSTSDLWLFFAATMEFAERRLMKQTVAPLIPLADKARRADAKLRKRKPRTRALTASQEADANRIYREARAKVRTDNAAVRATIDKLKQKHGVVASESTVRRAVGLRK